MFTPKFINLKNPTHPTFVYGNSLNTFIVLKFTYIDTSIKRSSSRTKSTGPSDDTDVVLHERVHMSDGVWYSEPNVYSQLCHAWNG